MQTYQQAPLTVASTADAVDEVLSTNTLTVSGETNEVEAQRQADAAAAAEADRVRGEQEAAAAAEAERVRQAAAAAAAADADRQRREQEEATNSGLLSEVMGSIADNPMGFKGGSNLLNYRTSSGQSLNDLPQAVQDQINAYLGGGEYGTLLNTAQDADPGTQLQRVGDEQRARDLAAQTEAAAREKREAASAAALATQQAAPTIQNSTGAIAQAAPVTTGKANVVAGVGAPTANQNTGLNTAINEQLANSAALDLESNDELRRNQQALLAEMSNQAEAAGKSAVTDLTLPDLTKVNVPAREMSTMEQAIDTRLTDRLTGGQFLDPQSALTNEAEAQALERLQQDNFLGESAGLDSAERRAMDRMTSDNLLGDNTGLAAAEAAALARMQEGGSGVDIEGVRTNADGSIGRNLATSAEDIIRQRLLGGENPRMAAQRARVEKRYGTSMDEGREMLNRLGVLRGGDTVDVFNELTSGRDQQMLDVDAMGFDLQSQAIADALGYQGRRDTLGLANEELARGAIGDVAGLAGQRDERNVAEQDLQRGAISDVSGLAGQRDERGIAEQGLRREAISDTLPFQQRRDAIGLAEQDLQRAAIDDALGRQGMIDDREFAEAELTGAMRGEATLEARMGQAGLQFDAANLQQDVSDRTLARLLTQTEPTQRERFEEGVRSTRAGERLATRADLRAEEGQQSDLYGEVAGRGSAPARQTLTGQTAQQDLMNQELQRLLARSGDTRADQALQSELYGEVAGVGSDPTVRQTRGGEMDAFNREMQRAGLTGRLDGDPTMQREELENRITEEGLDREYARRADDRAERGLVEDLLASTERRRVSDTADIRAESADKRAASADTRAESADTRAESADTRAETSLADDLLSTAEQRRVSTAADLRAGSADTRAESADTRAATSLADDLLSTAEQRRIAKAADVRAGSADTRAETSLADDLLSTAEQRRIAKAADVRAGSADTRAETSLADDLLSTAEQRRVSTAADIRAGSADTRAETSLADDLLSTAEQRRVSTAADLRAASADTRAESADTRAESALADDLISTAEQRRIAKAADIRAGSADTRAQSQFDFEQEDKIISQILSVTDASQDGRFDPLANQLLTKIVDPELQTALAQALEEDAAANRNTKSPDSAVMKVIKFFQGR